MNHTLVWTTQAIIDIAEIQNYLLNNFGVSVNTKFLNDVELSLKRIATYPESCTLVNSKKSVRKRVINKRITVFFKIEEEQIRLLSFFNTRKNPNSLNLD